MTIKSYLSGIFLICFSMTSFADCFFAVDFSGIQLEVDAGVDWKDYNGWQLAYATYVTGAKSPGWSGKPIHDLITSPFIDFTGSNNAGIYNVEVLKVGLSKDFGKNFLPMLLPSSCNVAMHNNDSLYVSGILHVPGNKLAPYFENLNCRLN